MAVPKRRQSSAKSAMRFATWQRKAVDAARTALSLGKSLTTRNAKGFFYPPSPVAGVLNDNVKGFGASAPND
jgi:ribosomal protein L32